MIDVIDVDPMDSIHIWALWRLLAERPAYANISHRAMPTMEQHTVFVRSRPYAEWKLLRATVKLDSLARPPKEIVGAMYLSKQHEVGIAIHAHAEGAGYAKQALEWAAQNWPRPLLANISPKNQRSIRMFESAGYGHIQNTYRLEEAST